MANRIEQNFFIRPIIGPSLHDFIQAGYSLNQILPFITPAAVNELKQGRTPLHLAIRLGDQPLVEALLKKGADPSCQTKTEQVNAFHLCATQPEILKFMLDFFANDPRLKSWLSVKDYAGQTPLYHAASSGQSESVALLIEKGADIGQKNGPGEVTAAEIADLKDPKMKACFPPQFLPKWNPLTEALVEGNIFVVEKYVKKGVELQGDAQVGSTPLFITAKHGHLNLVRKFLSHVPKPPIDQKNKLGFTPLYRAAEYGHAEVVDLLLQNGANPNIGNGPDAATALHISSANGQERVVRLFLSHFPRLTIDQEDATYHYTPLSEAARCGHLPVVKMLAKAGANIDKTVGVLGETFTPLYFAVHGRHTTVVDYLLDSGARIFRGENGTAFELASQMKFDAVLKWQKNALLSVSEILGQKQLTIEQLELVANCFYYQQELAVFKNSDQFLEISSQALIILTAKSKELVAVFSNYATLNLGKKTPKLTRRISHLQEGLQAINMLYSRLVQQPLAALYQKPLQPLIETYEQLRTSYVFQRDVPFDKENALALFCEFGIDFNANVMTLQELVSNLGSS